MLIGIESEPWGGYGSLYASQVCEAGLASYPAAEGVAVKQSHDYVVTCDGACPRNGMPGATMYGSWQMRSTWSGKTVSGGGAFSGHKATNNVAEYLALSGALEHLEQLIMSKGRSPDSTAVKVRLDSQLVYGHLSLGHRCKALHLRPLYRQAKRAMSRFKEVNLTKVPGTEIKRILGH